MYIIIQGNVFEGFEFIGPFDDVEESIEWADRNCGMVDWLTAQVTAPEDWNQGKVRG